MLQIEEFSDVDDIRRIVFFVEQNRKIYNALAL